MDNNIFELDFTSQEVNDLLNKTNDIEYTSEQINTLLNKTDELNIDYSSEQINTLLDKIDNLKIEEEEEEPDYISYSLDEQVIGKWIDERPIYQIVTEEPMEFGETVIENKSFVTSGDNVRTYEGYAETYAASSGYSVITYQTPFINKGRIEINITKKGANRYDWFGYYLGSTKGTYDIKKVSIDGTKSGITIIPLNEIEQENIYLTIEMNSWQGHSHNYRINSVKQYYIDNPTIDNMIKQNEIIQSIVNGSFINKYYLSQYTRTTDIVYPNNIETWLSYINTENTYEDLQEILDDSTILEQLMDNKKAVNYMLECTDWISNICDSQFAMTSIGNNNYCAEKLLTNEEWSKAIRNSNKYGKVLNTVVPKMTSNTEPEGECIGDSTVVTTINPNDWYYWKPFNRSNVADNAGETQSTLLAINNYWGYDFKKPVMVQKMTFKTYIYSDSNLSLKNFKVQGSLDGNTWTDIGAFYNDVVAANASYSISFFNTIAYRAYRIIPLDAWDVRGYIIIRNAQFYGREI